MAQDERDTAQILSELPLGGREDDVTRVMELYEPIERAYRASVTAGTDGAIASDSTNRFAEPSPSAE